MSDVRDSEASAADEALPTEAVAADPDEGEAGDVGALVEASVDDGELTADDEVVAIDASAPAEDDEEAAERAAPIPDEELDRIVEALLFASGDALTPVKIAQAAGGQSARRVRQAIDRLRAEYAGRLCSFDIMEIAGGYRLYTRPEYQEHVARLEKMKAPEKLSAASLETLAIIAYRQPIIRADIDSIRGVQSGAILKSLMDRKLIRVVGRSEQPGRPLQYGTTKRFLDHFGLGSIRDLPRVEDLKAP